ncbi:hypothetical protein [Planococcus versutus]|nr:hypothetical protein [Planococcus versutus]
MTTQEIAKELTIAAMQNGYIGKSTDSAKMAEKVLAFYKAALKTVNENQ